MSTPEPKAVRSRSRSPTRSPLSRTTSRTKLVLDPQGGLDDDTGEPLVSPARTFSPIAAGKRILKPSSPRVKVLRRPVVNEESILSKYLSQSLPAKLSAVLSVVVIAVAVALFFGEGDGPKLVKRDAPLVPGDRLKGGQYISFCTSIIATGCKPKYFELGRDGSLGVYGGKSPYAQKAKLWTAGTAAKGGATGSSYELLYSGDRVVLNKDGKVKWSAAVKSLPKNMQPHMPPTATAQPTNRKTEERNTPLSILSSMQALRTGALAQGSLRAIRGGTRASTGRGWYQRYERMGPDAFRKAGAPNPFDWDAPAPTTAPVGQEAEESERRKPRRRAFFDMSVDGVAAGRVEFELASDLLPVTSENFLRLCDGVAVASSSSSTPAKQHEGGDGGEAEVVEEEQEAGVELLCYEGSVIHRVVTGTGIMGGDVEGFGGKRSHSAFSGMRFFPDEAFLIPHTAPGLLTMANSGLHTNGSQFYITTCPAGHLDGRSVAFGRVTKGLEVVKAVYGMYSIRGKPVSEITIDKSGEMR
eukprot:g10992.t1